MSEDLNKKTNFLNTFLYKIKTNKKLQYTVIGVMLAIVLLICLFGFKVEEKQTDINQDEILIYVNNLETKLSNTLSKVVGAGNVNVVITVESGKESVLAMKTITKDGINGIETETSPIIINGKPVVVKELYPKIIGVLIVAKGANNILVMNRLQQATISLLDINLDQIEILTMN